MEEEITFKDENCKICLARSKPWNPVKQLFEEVMRERLKQGDERFR